MVARIGFVTKEWLRKRTEELELDGKIAQYDLGTYAVLVGKPFDKMSDTELRLYKIAFHLGRMYELEKIEKAANRE